MKNLAGCLLSALLFLAFPSLKAYGNDVWLVELKGAIGPASADFVMRSLDNAAEANAELIVLRLDTPGGLDLAMRNIIRAILASPVPVAAWVAPDGARAASAGTYIMYASHFAAMSPATNIGSSTPVSLGGGSTPLPGSAEPADGTEPAPGSRDAMETKVINDAVAYIKGLAELRGRNEEWAEQTVVAAANLTASEALELNVINFIARDIDQLLLQLDGQSTEIYGESLTLSVVDADVMLVEPDWRHEFLAIITDPNIAYILLMIGVYGIVLEFYNPGMGLPGIVGVICLLLGAFALQMLPINYVGLALILAGLGLMVAEVFSPSFGVLGLGGIAAFVLGSILLMDTELQAYRISIPIIAAFAVSSAAMFIYVLGAAFKNRQQKQLIGSEAMIGSTVNALEDFESKGFVRAFSENWQAVSDRPMKKGDLAVITDIDGLILKISKRE